MAGRSPKRVKEVFEAIEKKAEKVGLKINADKTKFMVSISQNLRRRFGQSLEIGQYFFEIIDEFTYLKTIITSDNNESMEVKKRLAKANKAYFGLISLLKSKKLTRVSKMTIYRILIRPIITYECWMMKNVDAVGLGVSERKILRRIFGAKK